MFGAITHVVSIRVDGNLALLPLTAETVCDVIPQVCVLLTMRNVLIAADAVISLKRVGHRPTDLPLKHNSVVFTSCASLFLLARAGASKVLALHNLVNFVISFLCLLIMLRRVHWLILVRLGRVFQRLRLTV
jgi:hypothetical protein